MGLRHAREILPFFMLVAALLAGLQADKEPPLQVVLDIDGKRYELAVGKTAQLDIAGKRRKVTVTAKPHRHFRAGGVEFHYPSGYGFDYAKEVGVGIWTLETADCTVMVQRYDAAPPALLLTTVVTAAAGEFEDVKKSAVAATLGGTEHKGKRLRIALDEETRIQQDYYAFRVKGGTVVLMIQDTLTDDSKPTEGTKRMLALLAKTFRIPE